MYKHITNGWSTGIQRKPPSDVRKHGVDFADAATVLTDDLVLTVQDNDPDEERFATIGMDATGAPSVGGLHVEQ